MNNNKKYSNRKFKRRIISLLTSIVLLCTLAVGSTIAFLTAQTDPIENTFIPGEITCDIVEAFDGKTKEDVCVVNTGDAPAYIRAAVIITWKDSEGNVSADMPVPGVDYTIEYMMITGSNLTVSGIIWNQSTAMIEPRI